MMVVSYRPLEVLMAEKGVNRKYLKDTLLISAGTLAKIAKGEFIALAVLLKICEHFDCRIQDVVEFVKVDSEQ